MKQTEMFDPRATSNWRTGQIQAIARALGKDFRRIGPCRLEPQWRSRQWTVWRSSAHTLTFRMVQGERPELAGVNLQATDLDAQLAWAVLWSAGDTTREDARAALMLTLGGAR